MSNKLTDNKLFDRIAELIESSRQDCFYCKPYYGLYLF